MDDDSHGMIKKQSVSKTYTFAKENALPLVTDSVVYETRGGINPGDCEVF